MANLLAIEAAADGCSIALQSGTNCIHRFEEAPRMHSRVLYPMLNTIFSEAGMAPVDLDAVVFSKGPGSFTGLRIAAATAQGIGYAANIPLIGISTLQAMSQRSFVENQTDNVMSILDARMNELYFGCYQIDPNKKLMLPLCEDFIAPIENASLPETVLNTPSNGCGNGWRHKEHLPMQFQLSEDNLYPDLTPQAQYLLPMANDLWRNGETIQPQDVELVYLREQSHWKTVKQQKQLK